MGLSITQIELESHRRTLGIPNNRVEKCVYEMWLIGLGISLADGSPATQT
jgi:hypothetical protein